MPGFLESNSGEVSHEVTEATGQKRKAREGTRSQKELKKVRKEKEGCLSDDFGKAWVNPRPKIDKIKEMVSAAKGLVALHNDERELFDPLNSGFGPSYPPITQPLDHGVVSAAEALMALSHHGGDAIFPLDYDHYQCSLYPQISYMAEPLSSPRPPYQHVPGQHGYLQPSSIPKTSPVMSQQRLSSILRRSQTQPTAPGTGHATRPGHGHGSLAPNSDIFRKLKDSVGLPENPNPPRRNSSLEDSFGYSHIALEEYVATKRNRTRREVSACLTYYHSGDTTEEEDDLSYNSASSDETLTGDTDNKLVDVSYRSVSCFNEAIELPSGTLCGVKSIQTKKPISRYFGEITQYSQKAYCDTKREDHGKVELRPRIKLVLPPRKKLRDSKGMETAKVKVEESPKVSLKVKAKKAPRGRDDGGKQTPMGAQPTRRSTRTPKKRIPFQG